MPSAWGPGTGLQDLTADDIQLYIRSRLKDVVYLKESEKENIVSVSTTWSSGVFLWVRLVVDSALGGLPNGDEQTDLDVRLNEPPRGHG